MFKVGMKFLKVTLLIFAFNISFSISAQNLKKSIINILDVYIEKEIKNVKRSKDSIVIDISFLKIEEEHILGINIYPIEAYEQVNNLNSIYAYKGFKTMIRFTGISNNTKLKILRKFKTIVLINKPNNAFNTIYEPHINSNLTCEFNIKKELYLISSNNNCYYYKKLQDKIKFAKSVFSVKEKGLQKMECFNSK